MQSLTAEAFGFLGGLISGKLVEDRSSQCVAACLSFFLFACLCQFVCLSQCLSLSVCLSTHSWITKVVCQFAIQGKLVADSCRHWVACLNCLSLRLLLTFLNFLLSGREKAQEILTSLKVCLEKKRAIATICKKTLSSPETVADFEQHFFSVFNCQHK